MTNSATGPQIVRKSTVRAGLASLLIGVGLLWIPSIGSLAQADEPATISAETLSRQMEGHDAPVILDVRSDEEYSDGHIPGAMNIPHTDLDKEIDQLAPYRDRDIVVYCVAGIRAARALTTLQKHGFSRLWHLAGDYSGWVKDGRQVEVTEAAVPH